MAERKAELLEVPYFHIVFTLPAEIGAIGRSAFQVTPQGWTYWECPETLRPEPALPHNSPDHERRSHPEEEQRQ